MTDFDLRPGLTLDPARSQIARGGFGAVENCTWAATSDTLLDFGYGDHAPADLRALDNELEQLGAYAGGETWQRNLRVIAFLAPDLAAAAAIEYPADVAGRLRELGAVGEEVHFAGWCTPSAVWTEGDVSGGLSHAGRTVLGDADGIAIWNVWTGYLVHQPDAFWNAAYDGGGILVFQRSLIPEEGATMKVIKGDQSPVDYVYDGCVKFGIATAGELADYLKLSGQGAPIVVSQFTLDKIPELRARAASDQLVYPAHMQATMDQVKAELDALAAHPGVAADPALLATVQGIAAKVNKDLA